LIDSRGLISTFSKIIDSWEGSLEREIGRKHVLEALNLTRFRLPQSEISLRPSLRDEDIATREAERAAAEGGEANWDVAWTVVSSAYE
tara:strand:- start:1265 stop:1528 length:264 start_codon:yes stop_codon:yes gene_type:complete